jgi:hypothetical protein
VVHEARHRTGTSNWWIKPRALAALVVATAGLAVAVWLPGRNDVASAAEQLPAFGDEFDAARGAGLDPEKWVLYGPPTAARHDGEGRLVLSQPMTSRVAFTAPFGHAEARVKVRRAVGPWRAFGVMDSFGRLLRGKVETVDRNADPTFGDDFHTYTVDWSPTEVLWSVDGRPSLRLIPDQPGLPLALVFNLATDGRRPTRMLVDFVRVATDQQGPVPSDSAAPEPSDSGEPSDEPSTEPTAEPTTEPTAEPEPPASSTPPATTPPASTPPATTKPPTTPPTSSAPKAKPWKKFTEYKAGDLVTYKGVTYRVKEAHTALPGWEPTALPNLFVKL